MPSIYQRNDAGEYLCPHCDFKAGPKNPSTMFYHIRKHTGEQPYTCSICAKGFIQKSGLTQHMLQVHASPEERPAFQCPCCDHASPVKANLLKHISNIHGSDWIPRYKKSDAPFECTGCKRVCSGSGDYYYHAIQCFTPPPEMATKLALLG